MCQVEGLLDRTVPAMCPDEPPYQVIPVAQDRGRLPCGEEISHCVT
jgi:hypothetical protein